MRALWPIAALLLAGCAAPLATEAAPANAPLARLELHDCETVEVLGPVAMDEARALMPAGYAPAVFAAGQATLVTAAGACGGAAQGFVGLQVVPPAAQMRDESTIDVLLLAWFDADPARAAQYAAWNVSAALAEAEGSVARTRPAPGAASVATAEARAGALALRLDALLTDPFEETTYFVRWHDQELGRAVMDARVLPTTMVGGEGTARIDGGEGPSEVAGLAYYREPDGLFLELGPPGAFPPGR